MVVGVLRVDLFLYDPQSLKEKRSIVKRILGRCRERFSVSAAETGLQELWQRTELGFVMVASDEDVVREVFFKVEEEIARIGLGDITERMTEYLHY